MRVGAEQQRVTVRRSARDRVGADGTRRARAVDDDHLLSKPSTQIGHLRKGDHHRTARRDIDHFSRRRAFDIDQHLADIAQLVFNLHRGAALGIASQLATGRAIGQATQPRQG